jgi:hypothetical protein
MLESRHCPLTANGRCRQEIGAIVQCQTEHQHIVLSVLPYSQARVFWMWTLTRAVTRSLCRLRARATLST